LDVEPDRAHLRLPYAHAHPLDVEPAHHRLRDRGGERLDQPELTSVDREHERGDLAVVDRVLEPVARAPVADLELAVEDEALAGLPLLLQHAVVSVQLEAAELELHPATARAAASASTCARTSCARRIVAPRSNAATAAPTDADAVPVLAAESPMIRPS